MARNNRAAETETAKPKTEPAAKKTTLKRAEFSIVNKIGTKNLGDPLKVLALEEGQKLLLGTIVGMASQYTQGTGSYGDYVALMGTFQAIPALINEKYPQVRSGKCFLPGTVVGQIMAAIDGGYNPQFAFQIEAEKVDRRDSPVGYVWRVTPLIESDDDPLNSLIGQIKDMPALPAPAAS